MHVLKLMVLFEPSLRSRLHWSGIAGLLTQVKADTRPLTHSTTTERCDLMTDNRDEDHVAGVVTIHYAHVSPSTSFWNDLRVDP